MRGKLCNFFPQNQIKFMVIYTTKYEIKILKYGSLKRRETKLHFLLVEKDPSDFVFNEKPK